MSIRRGTRLFIGVGMLGLASCNSDTTPPSEPPPPPPSGSPGTLTGTLVSSSTGLPIFGATISSGAATTTTAADGQFSLSIAAGDRVLVRIRAAGFAETMRPLRIVSGETTRMQAQLLRVGVSQSVSVAAGGFVSVPSSPARVTLPANGLVPVSGTPATNVTVEVTPINPAIDVNLMPGDYTTQSGGVTRSIESFGALLISISDAAGMSYNLRQNSSATVRIPMGSRSANPPATIPMFYLDENTGRWVQEGTATLQGAGTDRYYEGTVTHFTFWNADDIPQTIQVRGCVQDAANRPVANAQVQSDGIDYSGSATAFTASDGSFTVAMRRNGRATITAQSGLQVSNTVIAGPSATDFTLSVCLGTSVSTASLAIKLIWGEFPDDLDSHLFLPNGAHVSFSDNGGLVSPSYFASLDVDDVSGFGPEIVTVTRLMQGTYRYYVNNYSGSFSPGMTGSPAKVELTRAGTVSVFVPPAGEGTNAWWYVFDVVVSAQCNVTIQARGSWLTEEPNASPVANPAVCP